MEKGEISLTDLAQSESSLAGATAALIAAQNDLVTSKANFEKIIGKKSATKIQEKTFPKISLGISEIKNFEPKFNRTEVLASMVKDGIDNQNWNTLFQKFRSLIHDHSH